MSSLLIPVNALYQSYEFQIDLDGVAYGLRYNYNARMDRWTMGILDSQGNVLIGGVPMQHDWIPFWQYSGIGTLPTGLFVVYDESGEGKDPGRDDLGADVQLFYEESLDGQ